MSRSGKTCDSATFIHLQHPSLPLCRKRGAHRCATRVEHARLFFHHVLVHTKGDWARQPFVLTDWQAQDIIEPLFGEVHFDVEKGRFVRTYRSGWIELGRKNGKSELLAGIALYMLAFDGEESAEVYGAARDRDQARIVWDVASRMVMLSPVLSRRLKITASTRRIVDHQTFSFYTTVARDALGNLGQNPHCVIFDEVIAQPDDQLWNTMRTGMGARSQPMLLAATTAGNDQSSFAAVEHKEVIRIADDPARAPHRFVYVRNIPFEADPFDESLWPQANPALGDFLSISSLREEATEAQNDPTKENSFRQFRLNQWVSQATRWMPMHRYDENIGDVWLRPDWRTFPQRTVAWAGLDLSAKLDLTSFCIAVPDKEGHVDLLWRHWLPEDLLADLDLATSGQASVWARDGWLTVTEGNVIDYDAVYSAIEEDASHFTLREIGYDKWSGEPVRQALEARIGKTPMVPYEPGYGGMTVPMTELMSLFMRAKVAHHANPVARWCFDNVEVKHPVDNPDLLRPVKPDRNTGGKRIDAVPAAAIAVGGWVIRGQVEPKTRAVYGFR
jgi:phage terminase large subunit-like protein